MVTRRRVSRTHACCSACAACAATVLGRGAAAVAAASIRVGGGRVVLTAAAARDHGTHTTHPQGDGSTAQEAAAASQWQPVRAAAPERLPRLLVGTHAPVRFQLPVGLRWWAGHHQSRGDARGNAPHAAHPQEGDVPRRQNALRVDGADARAALPSHGRADRPVLPRQEVDSGPVDKLATQQGARARQTSPLRRAHPVHRPAEAVLLPRHRAHVAPPRPHCPPRRHAPLWRACQAQRAAHLSGAATARLTHCLPLPLHPCPPKLNVGVCPGTCARWIPTRPRPTSTTPSPPTPSPSASTIPSRV